MPLIIDSGTPAEQLEAFTTAMAQGRSVVITHNQWSDPLRRTAADHVARARELADTKFIPEGKLVIFTSGSSGQPHPVIRSAASWQQLIDPFSEAMGVGDDEVVWVPGSFASSLSLYGAWHARERGHEVVLGYRPHPSKLGRVTVAYVVPGILNSVLEAYTRGMLPQLRTIITGGTHIVPEVTAGARSRGVTLCEVYGSAELGSVAHRIGGGFVPTRGVEVDIRDGELWVRSPYLSEGYLVDDVVGSLRMEDGWATVADRAEWVDEKARTFALLGRGDIAVSQGEKVFAVADIEPKLRDMPGLTEVVVTNVLDHEGVYQLAAVIIDENEPDWAQVADAVKQMPADQRPVLWSCIAEAPRTANGAIDRSVLQAALHDGGLSIDRLPV